MAEKMSEMQVELLQRADAIFAKIAEAATAATDFAAAQLPDIAYQYIAFNRVYLTFIVVFCSIVLLVQQTLSIRNILKAKGYKDKDTAWMVYVMTTFITGTLSLPFVLYNLKAFFMVWFAPKIFLITNIVQLVRG